jgi:hypothetical protein
MHIAETTFLVETAPTESNSAEPLAAVNASELPYGVALPDHVIQFPFGGPTTPLVGSEDGSALYVGVDTYSLDFGRLLDEYFHWWSMPLAAIVLAIAIRRVLRAWQTPQVAGQAYCRNCNYNLAGVSQAPCPECGLAATPHRAIQGRTFLKRRWLSTFVALVCAAFLPVAWWAIPRPGLRLFVKADICSEVAFNTLEARGHKVPFRWIGLNTVMVKVDPANGNWTRIGRLPRYCWPTVTRTADGLGLFASGWSGNRRILMDVELATGRIRQSIPLPPDCNVYGLRTFVAGFSADPSTVLVHYVNEKERTSVLAEWNQSTDTLQSLSKIPAFVDPKYNTTQGRRFQQVPGDLPVKFISYAVFPETFSSASYPVTLFDEHGYILAHVDLGVTVSTQAELTLSCDGASFFLPTDRLSRQPYHADDHIQRFEIARLLRGDLRPASALSVPHNVWYQTALNSNDSLLFANCNGYVYVRDTTRKSWRAFLSVQANHTGPHYMVLSPDSSWVAATTRVDRQAGSTYFVTIWRVPAVPPGNPPASRTP